MSGLCMSRTYMKLHHIINEKELKYGTLITVAAKLGDVG